MRFEKDNSSPELWRLSRRERQSRTSWVPAITGVALLVLAAIVGYGLGQYMFNSLMSPREQNVSQPAVTPAKTEQSAEPVEVKP